MAVAVPATPLSWTRAFVLMVALGLLLGVLAAKAVPQIRHRSPASLTMVELENLDLMVMTQDDLQPDFDLGVSEPLRRMLPHRADGLVQPLWPWLAAWMGDGMDVGSTLLGTGMFRLGLAGGFLLLLGVVCARQFRLPAALWVVLMGAAHGLLPVLPFFTGEVLHQAALVVLWLACMQGMRQNSLWVYAAIGGAGALAWLSEARLVLPILAAFALVSSLRALWGWGAAHFSVQPRRSLWLWRNHWLGLLMLAAAFLVPAGPRLADAHQRYGDAFYTHAAHARWLPDARSAQAWMEAHPDAASLRSVPAPDRPSLAGTLAAQDPGGILDRLRAGARLLRRQMGGALPPLAAMLCLVVLLAVVLKTRAHAASHAGQRLHPETATVVLFSLVSLAACLITACWDAQALPVRHARALVLPVALTLAWAAEALMRRARRRGAGPWLEHAFQALVWALLVWTAAASQVLEV